MALVNNTNTNLNNINNTVHQSVLYSDDKVKSLFEQHLGFNNGIANSVLSNPIHTDANAKMAYEAEHPSRNLYSPNDPRNVNSPIQIFTDYIKLLQRAIPFGGANYLKFIGMYELLAILNPRMALLVNPLAVPPFATIPQGIVPISLDVLFADYKSIVMGFEQPGPDSIGAAMFGTNLGQIEGPDFQQATSLPDTIVEKAVGVLKSIFSSEGNSIDPNKKSLLDRLQGFNKTVPDQQGNSPTPQQAFGFLNGNPANENFKITAAGDVIDVMSSSNQDGFDALTNAGHDFDTEFLDTGSSEADKLWLVYNIKPNASTVGKKFKRLYTGKFAEYVNQVSTTGVTIFPNVLLDDNAEAVKAIKEDSQFPFFFEEVGDMDTSWLALPATIKSLTESFTPEVSPGNTYVGRSEKPVVWSSNSRTINFTLALYVNDPSEFNVYKFRLNWLAQRTYPKYHETTTSQGRLTLYKNPPLIRMTVGDLYYRLGGYISALSYNWNQSAEVWEKHLRDNRIPLYCDLTIAFNVLHDFVPDGYSVFWGSGDSWSNATPQLTTSIPTNNQSQKEKNSNVTINKNNFNTYGKRISKGG